MTNALTGFIHAGDKPKRTDLSVLLAKIEALEAEVAELKEQVGEDVMPTVPTAVAGNLAAFTSDGKVADSTKKPSDFAAANHNHEGISYDENNWMGIDENGLILNIGNEQGGGESEITPANIGNFNRALEDPEAPVEDGDVLITNGQVHAALVGLDSIRAVHKNSSGVIVDTASVITGWDGVDNHAYIQLQLTHAPFSPKNAFITPANINNLKTALDGFESGVVQDSAMLVSSGAVFEAIAAATTLISKTYYDDGETTDEAINLDEDYVCANKQMYKVAITGTQGVDVENLFCTDDAADTITIFGNTTTIAAGKTAFIDAYKVDGGYILHVTGVYDTSSAVTAGGATQSQGE